MDERKLIFNGVQGAGGGYAIPPLSGGEVLSILRRGPRRADSGQRGVAFGVDPGDLASAGWGVVFARGADPAVLRALQPLIEHRRSQAAAKDERRFRVFAGDDGWLPGESKSDFLHRHGAGRGPVEPDRMPYYLLLVGGPDEIPYELQYRLDLQHAVGRLAFDSPWEYADYAATLIDAERGRLRRPRRVALFGAANPDDRATQLSAESLVRPLADGLGADGRGFDVELRIGADAHKADLASLLGGDATPALLFTATHGVCFGSGDRWQRSHQGALLCQDWPGPKQWSRPVPPDHYFAASDVAADAAPAGLVAFFFACYSAGTPRYDDFVRTPLGETCAIAPAPLVARLPQRLLGHPRGGALAVIGHVERAWTYSFLWGSQHHRAAFDGLLRSLTAGWTVGMAMDCFALALADTAEDLIQALHDSERGGEVDRAELNQLWTAHNDARNYTVLGDPAVRLAVEPGGGDGGDG